MKINALQTVWTTNFDDLVLKACSGNAGHHITCIDIGHDSKERRLIPHAPNQLHIISLHGDYRYDELKNTSEELKSQESEFIQEMKHELRDRDLIVIGYSGRDLSLMKALNEVYQQNGKGRLYWCYCSQEPGEEVKRLLHASNNNNRIARLIPIDGFDDSIVRMAKVILPAELEQQAKVMYTNLPTEVSPTAPFRLRPTKISTLLRSILWQNIHSRLSNLLCRCQKAPVETGRKKK